MNLNWEKIKEEILPFQAFRKLVRRTFKMPDSSTGEFDIKLERSPVCILALTKDNKVILFEQFRPGPEKILKELPGGNIEKDESPQHAAERELKEETGYKGKMIFVGRIYECAYSTIHRYAFVATDCELVAEPNLDKTEFGQTVLMSLDEFREHLRSGNLTDVEIGYLGLDYLKLL